MCERSFCICIYGRKNAGADFSAPARVLCVLVSAKDQIFMQTSHARQMTVRRLPMATQSPTRCT